jgi:hypothetical protein
MTHPTDHNPWCRLFAFCNLFAAFGILSARYADPIYESRRLERSRRYAWWCWDSGTSLDLDDHDKIMISDY